MIWTRGVPTVQDLEISKDHDKNFVNSAEFAEYRRHEGDNNILTKRSISEFYDIDSDFQPMTWIFINGDYDNVNPVNESGFCIQTSEYSGLSEEESLLSLLAQVKNVQNVLQDRLKYITQPKGSDDE